jgi:TolA-binding protein
VPDAQLKMGYIHYEQGNWVAAREQLQSLVQRFPDSTAARLANERLQRMSREGH